MIACDYSVLGWECLPWIRNLDRRILINQINQLIVASLCISLTYSQSYPIIDSMLVISFPFPCFISWHMPLIWIHCQNVYFWYSWKDCHLIFLDPCLSCIQMMVIYDVDKKDGYHQMICCHSQCDKWIDHQSWMCYPVDGAVDNQSHRIAYVDVVKYCCSVKLYWMVIVVELSADLAQHVNVSFRIKPWSHPLPFFLPKRNKVFFLSFVGILESYAKSSKRK